MFGLACFAGVQPAAAHHPTSTPVSGLSSAGDGVALAPDGSMWVSEPTAPGRVARVSKEGVVTEYTGGVSPGFTPNLAPAGMTITADGQAWFLLRDGSSEVGRVNMAAGTVHRYKLTTGTPTSVATGSDGKLWFTAEADLMASDYVGRYTLASNLTETFSAGLSWQTDPRSLVPGTDGSLAFVEGGGAGRVGRITTDGTMDFRASGGAPAALGVVPDGALWFARSTQLGPLGGTSSTLIDVGKAVTAFAPGPDGALWGATTGGVVRLTASGQATTFDAGIDPAAKGRGIAAGADGRMWMTLDRAPFLVKITVPPRVGTTITSALTATTATLTTPVRPNGLPTTSVVKARAAGGNWQQIGSVDAGNGTEPAPVRFDLTGLAPSTAYELKIVTSNDAGEIETSLSLTTPAAPTPEVPPTTPELPPTTPEVPPTTPELPPTTPELPPTTPELPVVPDVPVPTKPEVTKPPVDDTAKPNTPVPAKPMPTTPAPTTPAPKPEPPAPTQSEPASEPVVTPTATPAPVQDKTVVVRSTRGTVVYRVPGSTTVREVDGAASIPTNSIIDTTKGEIVLSSRVNGAVQNGTFYGGEFKVKQVKRTGMTQLHLKGEMDCTSDPAKATKSAAKKAKKRRHVWGQDSGGRFETHGKDSVATVRGTKWLTTDTCEGTVVKVYEGAVSVKPRRGRGKAVLVKAGGRHFTPAPTR